MEVLGMIAGGLSFSQQLFDHGRFAMVWSSAESAVSLSGYFVRVLW